MKINKITIGYVIQEFDTETGKFDSQEFIAGDEVEWENKDGESVPFPTAAFYLPFEMVQP